MIRRPRRVIPATLVALVVLAACVVTAISIIQELAGRPPLIPFADLDRHVRALRLDGVAMVSAGGIAAGLGLILLGCAVIPGRSSTLVLAAIAGDGTEPVATSAGRAAGVSRLGLRAALGAAVGDVDGVTRVRVRVGARRVTARVRTELDETDSLRAAVGDVLERRLGQSGLARNPVIRVNVRRKSRRAAA